MEKLWGDWYFDAKRKVWTTSDNGGALERAFCQFIATPITTLFEAIMAEKTGKVNKMLKAIGVELKTEEKELVGKQLLKRVMQKWLPAGDCVLEMIVLHLPSPRQGPGLPCRHPLRGSPRRQDRHGHPHLRHQRRRPPLYVHLQDGPHLRQGTVLRLRPCLLRQDRYRPEGPHHGPQLRARQEVRALGQEHPAYCYHDR